MITNNSPAELERLREKLYDAQRVVLGLMSPEAQSILEPFVLKDVVEWDEFVVPRIVELAKPIGETERALCPLCGHGPQNGYNDGFKLPEGLTRHLNGTHQFHRCGVMAVAEDFAKHYFARRKARQS